MRDITEDKKVVRKGAKVKVLSQKGNIYYIKGQTSSEISDHSKYKRRQNCDDVRGNDIRGNYVRVLELKSSHGMLKGRVLAAGEQR